MNLLSLIVSAGILVCAVLFFRGLSAERESQARVHAALYVACIRDGNKDYDCHSRVYGGGR